MSVQSTNTNHQSHETNSGINLLFLSSFPLLLTLLQGGSAQFVTAAVAVGLFVFALRLMAMGIAAQAAYDADPDALRPGLPRKTMGAVLIGEMVFFLADRAELHSYAPIALGVSATLLCIITFGPDPHRHKIDPAVLKRKRQIRAVRAAHSALTHFVHRVQDTGDSELARQTAIATSFVQKVLINVQNDSESLERIQKPMAKFIGRLDREVQELEDCHPEDLTPFQRSRFAAKLRLTTETLRDHLVAQKIVFRDDQLAQQAHSLLHRMEQEISA